MLRFIHKISLAAILAAGAVLYVQDVMADGRVAVQLSPALANLQPVNNQLPKADPRRYSPPAATYQRHARDYSQMLYYQGTSQAGLKPAQAQQYVGAIKKNVELSSKELKAIQAAHPNDARVKELVAKIEEHHAKAAKQCDMINEESQKSKLDNVKICDCCVDIDDELKAAEKETEALLKHLKLDNVPAMRKSTDKVAPK